MKIIAFVHAKGNSERVPGKNLRMLGDKPLFCHAISNAKKSMLISEVVIDSDSDKILNIGDGYGATPLKRPEWLAQNTATGDDLAYWQANNYTDSDIILQLPPTSPFLLPSSIDNAINLLIKENVDSVAGVFCEVFYEWVDGKPSYYNATGNIPNSFEKKPLIYETMGLCVVRTSFAMLFRRRLNSASCLPYFLSRIEAIDINTEDDFSFAQTVWAGLQT